MIAEKSDVMSILNKFRNKIEGFCDHPYDWIDRVLSWTRGEPSSTKNACDIVVEEASRIPQPPENQIFVKSLLRIVKQTESPEKKLKLCARILEVDPDNQEVNRIQEEIRSQQERINQDFDEGNLNNKEEANMVEQNQEQPNLEELGLDELLDEIVTRARDIETIVLVDLNTGEGQYFNRKLQSDNPELFKKLIGKSGRSDLLEHFRVLKPIPKAFNQFAQQLKVGKSDGELEGVVLILNEKSTNKEKLTNEFLAERPLIVSFTEVEGEPFAICYLSKEDISIGRLLDKAQKSLQMIKEALKKDRLFLN